MDRKTQKDTEDKENTDLNSGKIEVWSRRPGRGGGFQ